MRYGEQVFEIPVELTDLDLRAPDARAAVEARFHRRHEALFTYSLPDQDVALANARLAVTGRLPPLPGQAAGAGSPAAPVARRRVWLDGAWTEVPVWPFETLAAGQGVDGPALVQAATTAVLLRRGDRARLDGRGWLEVDVGV